MSGILAVVPVKEFEGAKQRLSSCLSPEERRALATTMLEDVLDARERGRDLAGLIVVTVDPVATSLAARATARASSPKARATAIPARSPPPSGCLPVRAGRA